MKRLLPGIAGAIACGFLPSISAGDGLSLPWYLGDDCDTCLGISETWDRFGRGSPDVSVLVAEPRLYADTRAAIEWHAGLDPRRFEVVVSRFDQNFHPAEEAADQRELKRQAEIESDDALDALAGVTDRPRPEPVKDGLAFCSFVAAPNNHDLHMASLIGADPYLDTSGVAPRTRVLITQASIAYDAVGKPVDGPRLVDLIQRRPDIRVVNISQGQGQHPDEARRVSANPHRRHYQMLDRLAMDLAMAGTIESRRAAASRLLIVASAGNVPAFESNVFEPQKVLNSLIPPEAIHHGVQQLVYTDLRPHYLDDVPGLDLPLLVVGAIGPEGRLPSYARIDQGIDIYAPVGLDWAAHLRNNVLGDQTLGGADWQDCTCLDIANSQNTSLADATDDGSGTATFERLTGTCRPLDGPAGALLGLPVADFHAESAGRGRLLEGLRKTCADEPLGNCTARVGGTSAAAAIVSGVAALVFSVDPALSGEEVARIIRRSARTDNRLRLPVMNPGGALDQTARGIVERVLANMDDPARLAGHLGDPVLVAASNGNRFAFTAPQRAATYVAGLFGGQEGGERWRALAVEDATLRRCAPGTAGSTVGIGDLLDGLRCRETERGIEVLTLSVEVASGSRRAVLNTAWYRGDRLDPTVRWRLAGLKVNGG
ncbi:MAG: S8 family serine peptidase [Pseudomonadota bacterium]